MAKYNLKFTEILTNFDQQVAVCWEDIHDKSRYHIWVKIPSLEPVVKSPGSKNAGQIELMKNPPIGTVYRGAGHFDTRHLNGSLPRHKKMIDETIAYIKANGLLEKALAKQADKQTRRDAEALQERLVHFVGTIRSIAETFLSPEQNATLGGFSDDAIISQFKRDMKDFIKPPVNFDKFEG